MATRTTTKKAELKTSTAKPAIEKEAPAKLAAKPTKTEPAKATVTETATEKAVKKAPVKKVTEAKTEKKAPAKKPAAKKPAARKTTAKKKVTVNTEVYVQWLGKEVDSKTIVDNIKKIWTEEMGKKESELVDLKVYIKPEDNGAHYVINGDITGFISL